MIQHVLRYMVQREPQQLQMILSDIQHTYSHSIHALYTALQNLPISEFMISALVHNVAQVCKTNTELVDAMNLLYISATIRSRL